MMNSGGFLEASIARQGLAGFLLAGVLLSFLGAILPAWGHHLDSDFVVVAQYFLSMNAGILLAQWVTPRLLRGRGMRFPLGLACGLACGGFFWLAASSPPVDPIWRIIGLLWVGLGAGLLNTFLFRVVTPVYRHDSAATVNLAGIFFGLGCLMTALLVAGTFYVYTVGSIVTFLAVIPGLFLGMYAKADFSRLGPPGEIPASMARENFESLPAVLFALLLFFQFGNEWAIAGWLPLFLVQRIGASPESSLLTLAFYWASLIVGRVAAQALLARFSHRRILLASVLSAWFGCTLLWVTNNLFGASVGVLLTGWGFASIYPLVVEKIGKRFAEYTPPFFNGIFLLASSGALLAQAALGFLAEYFGVGIVMGLPMLGTAMVFVLLVLITLEAKLSGMAGVQGHE